jgi:hypothetical protein
MRGGTVMYSLEMGLGCADTPSREKVYDLRMNTATEHAGGGSACKKK